MKNIIFKPFLAFLFVFIILLVTSLESDSQIKSQVKIKVNSAVTTGSVEPVWNGIGGSLGLALTPQGDRLLKRIDEASSHPFYRRCWGVTESGTAVPFTAEVDYGSTNVYQVDENGQPFYDFTLFDQIFDIILSRDFIPIMHIGSMPDSLSSSPLSTLQETEDIKKYPPKDYNRWYDWFTIL